MITIMPQWRDMLLILWYYIFMLATKQILTLAGGQLDFNIWNSLLSDIICRVLALSSIMNHDPISEVEASRFQQLKIFRLPWAIYLIYSGFLKYYLQRTFGFYFFEWFIFPGSGGASMGLVSNFKNKNFPSIN